MDDRGLDDGVVRLREWADEDASWYAESVRDALIQRFTTDSPTLDMAQVLAALVRLRGSDSEEGFVICDSLDLFASWAFEQLSLDELWLRAHRDNIPLTAGGIASRLPPRSRTRQDTSGKGSDVADARLRTDADRHRRTCPDPPGRRYRVFHGGRTNQ
jgi:hypothetical protein